jgi:hypothetical protein
MEILRSIPGTVGVALLDGEQRRRAAELASLHKLGAALPVKNLGAEQVAFRDACFALLKDGRFRPPDAPTVYLIEESARENAEHAIIVERARHAVLGRR